jgi:acyl-CoA reductase-like NAD-dependent aldehyde dehydrogenase
VLAAIPFGDYDEALQIANSVCYGLTASIFTRDLATAHRFARGVEAGYVWVNDASKHFPGAPFGGFKDSGVGREETSLPRTPRPRTSTSASPAPAPAPDAQGGPQRLVDVGHQ